VLVGNYSKAPHGEVHLPLPLKSISKASVVDGKSLPIEQDAVSLDVPPGEFRLIHLTGPAGSEK
jgi:hypothetical protein